MFTYCGPIDYGSFQHGRRRGGKWYLFIYREEEEDQSGFLFPILLENSYTIIYHKFLSRSKCYWDSFFVVKKILMKMLISNIFVTEKHFHMPNGGKMKWFFGWEITLCFHPQTGSMSGKFVQMWHHKLDFVFALLLRGKLNILPYLNICKRLKHLSV